MKLQRIPMRWTLGLAACALLTATAGAQCGVADVYEDNDDCLNAVALTAGTYSSLTCQGPADPGGDDQDYFRVTVPAGDILTVDVLHSWSTTEDIDAYLYDAANPTCGDQLTFLTRGYTSTDNENMAWPNSTGASVDIIIEVSAWIGGSTQVICDDYDLVIGLAPDPCQAGVDDSFEENDTCGAAAVLAAGVQTGLFVSTTDEDYYKITVAPGDQVLIDQTYNAATAELGIDLYDDAACTNFVAGQNWSGGLNQVAWANSTAAPVDFFLRAFVANGDCNNYDLSVVMQPDPCQLALDDPFEDNDSCAAAVALPAGLTAGLFTSITDEDFFLVNVPAGEILTIDEFYVGTTDLDMDLYDDLACTNFVDGAAGFGGAGQVSWSNTTGAAATLVLKVSPWASSGDCNSYDLNVATAPDPCQNPLSDDAFEDNETCATATTISTQSYPGLFVSKSDADVYTFQLNPGGTADISVDHLALNGDIDVHLYDDTPGVCLDGVSFVVGAETGGDNEVIFWTNNTGSTVTYYLHVELWANSSSDCNNYDLNVTLVGNQIATATCAGDGTYDSGAGAIGCPCGNNSALGAGEGCLNSQGHGATIDATGSNVVANDNMVFHVAQARPNQPSMLVQGSVLTGFPFKDGILCMGNPTERVEVVFLDPSGEGSTTVSIVTEGAIPGPGVTRFYQFWYRDPAISVCGNGSNFSSGLSVAWM